MSGKALAAIVGTILSTYLMWGVGYHGGYDQGHASGFTDGWAAANARRLEMDQAETRTMKSQGLCHYATLVCTTAEER